MLTIFTIPKPFIGHIGIIQRNAIQSWMQLVPHCKIILCGNDESVKEAANQYSVGYLPNVKINEFGTPLLNSAFNLVQGSSSTSLICYVNTDIIFLQSILDVVKLLPFEKYLILGQRWNLDIQDPIDYSNETWVSFLSERITKNGVLQPRFGSDFFMFPKEINWNLPDFAVGRPGWDNWLIYKARTLQIPVVDATAFGFAVHQNHDYIHIPAGTNSNTYEGPEANNNRSLMGTQDTFFNIGDATHIVKEQGIVQAKDFQYLQYRIIRQPLIHPKKGIIQKFWWRILQALFYRRKYFPSWFLKNLIYFSTK